MFIATPRGSGQFSTAMDIYAYTHIHTKPIPLSTRLKRIVLAKLFV
jgi:hypothetical protein